MIALAEEIFPKVYGGSSRDPHWAIVRFVADYLVRLVERSMFVSVEEEFESLLNDPGRGSPGFGFDYAGGVFGYYDEEKMCRYEIERFSSGSAFLAYYESDASYEEATYSEVLYSREEMGGWLSVGVEHLSALLTDDDQTYDRVVRRYFSPSKQIATLVDKLQGHEPWAYGPLGGPGAEKLDATEISRWRAFHSPGFHLNYVSTCGSTRDPESR